MACHHLGLRVSRLQIYERVPPGSEDTDITALIDVSRTFFKLNWFRIRDISQRRYGAEFAIVNILIGVYILILNVVLHEGGIDRHAVVYVAHQNGGTLLDNDPGCNVIFVREHDRASKEAARAVFAGLFPAAKEVRVMRVYHMLRII